MSLLTDIETINIPALTTDVVSLYHSALNRATTFVATVETDLPKALNVANTIEAGAVKVGQLALPILEKVAPADAGALQLVINFILWLESLNAEVLADLQKNPGFAALYAQYQSGKLALIKFESTI